MRKDPSVNTPGRADHSAEPWEVVPSGAVEPKTKLATVGAGSGVIVATFLLYLIDVLFYGGPGSGPDVPEPVQTFVVLLVSVAGAFAGGYYARHVNRVQ